jgi:hypothetical protein
MVELGPYVASYANINEEGDEYETHDNIDDALATLVQFPNDVIEVTLKHKPDTFNEWMITGHDGDGNVQRTIIHAKSFANAAEDANLIAHDWVIDSIVRQEEHEFDPTCRICGDPRGH